MQKLKNLFIKNESGQLGIGTLIIFTALVLVSSVAASVLIQTSDNLQQKAQATSDDAIEDVTSNLKVKSIEGFRSVENIRTIENLNVNYKNNDLSNTIDLLKIRTTVGPGGNKVDISKLIITIKDGKNRNVLKFISSNENDFALENSKSNFTAKSIRDDDRSFNTKTPIMSREDLITLDISTLGEKKKYYNETMREFNSSKNITTNLNHNITSESYYALLNSSNGDIVPKTNNYTISTTKDTLTYNNNSTTLKSNYTYYLNYTNPNETWTKSGLELKPSTKVNIVLTPETGRSKNIEFETPSAYGIDRIISLYP